MPHRLATSCPAFKPPVIAHRGASAHAPENTLAAFRRAHADGARWLETDVKLTQDGVPILFHDATLERTTNGHGTVAETPWSALQALDAGSWFGADFAGERIPSLEALLLFAIETEMALNLELKPCPGRAKATVMVTLVDMTRLWPEQMPPPLLSSMDVEALEIAAALHPEWPRGLILDTWHPDWSTLVHRADPATLHINVDHFDAAQIETLQASRLPLLGYTINDPARAQSLLDSGLLAVFTDRPGDLLG